MKAYLLLGGEAPSRKTAQRICGAFIAAADSAYDWATRYGICPDVLIGDCDSIRKVPEGIRKILFSSDKDDTDGELALDWLIQNGYREIEIYGSGGKREDHFYANFGLLRRAKLAGIRATLVSDYTETVLIDGCCEFNFPKNTLISIEPFGGAAHIMITEGLKYRIADRELDYAKLGYGISNVVTEEKVKIELSKGSLLLFKVLKP